MRNLGLIIIALIICSCDDLFEVTDISEQQVIILAPKNTVTFSNNDTINFSWEALEDAETYEVQLATPDFENATQIVLDSITETTRLNATLNTGDYQWRVRAVNSGYTTAYTTSEFTIE